MLASDRIVDKGTILEASDMYNEVATGGSKGAGCSSYGAGITTRGEEVSGGSSKGVGMGKVAWGKGEKVGEIGGTSSK